VNDPLLSVCLITYNHASFIRQAIDSVLAQKVDFRYELIIADDYSQDETRNIILEYKEKYPDIIRLIFQTSNVGPAKNWFDLLRAPRGKYIAYFEGDDYWTDPYKLQQQVDFLEANDDFSMCFTNAYYDTGDVQPGREPRLYSQVMAPKVYSLNDILIYNMVPTATVLYRANFKLPDWFFSLPYGDWGLHILSAHKGKVYYLNKVTAAYRVHDMGLFSSKNTMKRLEGSIATGEILRANLDSRHKQTLLKGQHNRYFFLLKEASVSGTTAYFISVYLRFVKNTILSRDFSNTWSTFKMLLRKVFLRGR
jgi:glycosyltransferase involved in cell wall biosynthesis